MKYLFKPLVFLVLSTVSFQSFSQAPVNDVRSAAIELELDSVGDYFSSGAPFNNRYATPDGAQPANWQSGPNQNVWFKFKPGPSGIANITVRNGGVQRSMLALYDSSMNEVDSRGYETNYWVNNGLILNGLDTAQNYYLSVDSYIYGNYKGGTFDLYIQGELNYDYKEGALELPLDSIGNYFSSGTPFNSRNATPDGAQPANWQDGPNQNVWFKFKPGPSGIANITVKNGGIQRSMLALYDSSMNEVGSKGYETNYWTNNSLILDSLDTAQYYYLTVDSYVYASYKGGTFDLYIQSDIGYDYKEGAIELNLDSAGNYFSLGAPFSNRYATADGVQPNNWQNGPNQNIWFKFKPGPSGIANITVKNGGIQRSMLALYDSSMNEVGSKGYETNFWINNSLALHSLDTAQYYYLAVDSYVYASYRGGTFDLFIKGGVDYDFKEEALELELDSVGNYFSSGFTYSNLDATADGNQPNNWQNGPNQNVWFKFKPGPGGMANITVKNGGIQRSMLALYDSSMNEVGSKGYEVNYWTNNGLVVDSLDTAQYYYLSIDSYVYGSFKGGTFDLTIQGQLHYDYKEGAIELPLDSAGNFTSNGAPYNNSDATSDGDQPTNWQSTPNKNIWFKVWIPSTGYLSVEINRGTIRRIMYAFYDSQDSLIANDGYTGDFDSRSFNVENVTGNQFYYLAVDSYVYSNWLGGSFDISFDFQDQIDCANELWAISSGSWNDPDTWSDTEGGQPISAIPCKDTVVYIKGFDVSLNTTQSITAKRIEVIGTSSSVLTRLNVQSGELSVTEKIVTTGAGAKLKISPSSRVKVSGGGE